MNSVKAHYEGLLGELFAWSVSAAGDPFERGESWLRERQLFGADTYLDLGAGFGAHVLPLLRAGKRVTAVDFDAALLRQLRHHTERFRDQIDVRQDDFLDYLARAEQQAWGAVLCLGDTLTHLESHLHVADLIALASRRLVVGGRLALQYRDLTAPLAEGLDRFIFVASDAERSMICLIEALDEQRVRVTDIVTELTPEGPRTRLGDYQKLRIAPAQLLSHARSAGLELVSDDRQSGLVSLVFQRLGN